MSSTLKKGVRKIYKIYVEDMERDIKIEITNIEAIPENTDCLFFFSKVLLNDSEKNEIEKRLEETVKKRCVILSPWAEKIIGA